MTRRLLAHFIVVGALLLIAATATRAGCEAEPASQWAPAGFVCDPVYGEGTASMWGGPGTATNSCVWPFDCDPIQVTSLDTGRSIVTTPTTWCHCWVGVTGPNGETARIVDLDPGSVLALGLNSADGLWRVTVQPFYEVPVRLPDTRMDRP